MKLNPTQKKSLRADVKAFCPDPLNLSIQTRLDLMKMARYAGRLDAYLEFFRADYKLGCTGQIIVANAQLDLAQDRLAQRLSAEAKA